MRGGHSPTANWGTVTHGSSPHARGTLADREALARQRRFIPACAGDTRTWLRRPCRTSVHPRMRGGHSASAVLFGFSVGSSPHARGTRRDVRRGGLDARFIPACAGDTRTATRSRWRSAVHPRMRGGHQGSAEAAQVAHGSSPHARGTRGLRTAHASSLRFIPACAGDTNSRAASSESKSVHPRMRGGHGVERMEAALAGGSSPHARGTLARCGRVDTGRRFIPACAGDTKKE